MSLSSLPVGCVIAWENAIIPDGWQISNGTNGTLDLRHMFIRGASIDADLGVAAGVASHLHTNPNTDQRLAHDHGGSATVGVGGVDHARTVNIGSSMTSANRSHHHGDTTGTVPAVDAHDHTLGDTGSAAIEPPNVRRVYIARVEV